MFELFQSEKTGKFHFNLKAGNGQIILTSQAYADKGGAMNGIESVKKNSQDDSKFELKTGANGKFHFTLKAGNGQVIGSSQMYAQESGAKNGMESIAKNAPGAEVKDMTA